MMKIAIQLLFSGLDECVEYVYARLTCNGDSLQLQGLLPLEGRNRYDYWGGVFQTHITDRDCYPNLAYVNVVADDHFDDFVVNLSKQFPQMMFAYRARDLVFKKLTMCYVTNGGPINHQQSIIPPPVYRFYDITPLYPDNEGELRPVEWLEQEEQWVFSAYAAPLTYEEQVPQPITALQTGNVSLEDFVAGTTHQLVEDIADPFDDHIAQYLADQQYDDYGDEEDEDQSEDDEDLVTLSAHVGPLSEDIECSICLGNPQQPRVTSCGHYYCGGCISQWIDTGNRKCPLCRRRIQV